MSDTQSDKVQVEALVGYKEHPDSEWKYPDGIQGIQLAINARVDRVSMIKLLKIPFLHAVKTIHGNVYNFASNKWEKDWAKITVKEGADTHMQETFHPIPNIDKTLAERGSRYGTFTNHSLITQNIKDAMRDSPNWDKLAADQKECLEMIAHKVGRILNGDPDYHDSWHDIVGYTKLVADRLLGISK